MIARKLIINLTYQGEHRRLHLHKTRQESYLHILIKIMAHIYFWHENLEIEPNLHRRGYRPDLIRLDNPVNPKIVEKEVGLWVECKTVKLQKLDDLVRYLHADIYWFHTYHHLQTTIASSAYKKYKRLDQVEMIGMVCDDDFVLIRNLQEGVVNWHIERDVQGSNIRLDLFLEGYLDPVEVRLLDITKLENT